jgi:chromosome segregation ATPase
MANDKNIINELVAQDDTTAQLEALADTYDFLGQPDDQRDRSETIDRLQFDIEQLRSRWNGLEAEIKARKELTTGLNRKLDEALVELQRKEQLVQEQEQTITSLQAVIRCDETRHEDTELERQAGRLTCAEAELRELRIQIERTEAYADDMRRQLQERMSLTSRAEDTQEHLQIDLQRAVQRVSELETCLDEAKASNKALENEIAQLGALHADEIRVIRFELGEAQETLTQHELISEQLASDLVDTRGSRDELEKSLLDIEQQTRSRIESLEMENRRLRDELDHHQEQLENKGETINCLLAELAKKPQQSSAKDEIVEVIDDIDERVAEQIQSRPPRDRGRLSRVLIGKLDQQELRFPLFKNRLTIGRTDLNDIQLKATYVSRRHAVVVTDRDSARIIDWGSRNGVFVNGERVTEHFLRNGDNVRVGTAEFRYEERPKRDA